MPYWRLFYHVVWAAEHRLSLIEPACESDLFGHLRDKAISLECIPHAIGGMPDHIHIAISVPPKLPVATLIGQLKGASSHHANQIFANGAFAWQNMGYSVFQKDPCQELWDMLTIKRNTTRKTLSTGKWKTY
jgi:putative transposase